MHPAAAAAAVVAAQAVAAAAAAVVVVVVAAVRRGAAYHVFGASFVLNFSFVSFGYELVGGLQEKDQLRWL